MSTSHYHGHDQVYDYIDTCYYLRSPKLIRDGKRTLLEELSTVERNDVEQYGILAYTNDYNNRYVFQTSSNMMMPVYFNMAITLPLKNYLKIGYEDPVVIFIESFRVNDAMQLKDLIGYYKNTPMHISTDPGDNILAAQDMMTILSKSEFPAVIKVLHVIKTDRIKDKRRVHIPILNLMLYKNGADIRYAGDHIFARNKIAEIGATPKTSLADKGLYQHLIRIINNEEPGRKYYTTIFNKVVEIESTPSMSGKENSCIKIAYYVEDRTIEQIASDNIRKETLRERGIFLTKMEAEENRTLEEQLAKIKLDIELEKVSLARETNLIKTVAMRQNSAISTMKFEIDKSRLVLDKEKLILERDKLEVEYDKLIKEIKLLERGYRNEISKITINEIKEMTDAINIVTKLASLVKNFFTKDK